MTDQFAVLNAEVKDEPYRVEIPTVGKFVIPHINSASIFELNEMVDSAKSDMDLLTSTLEFVMGAKEYERLRKSKINRATLVALYIAWQEHCGLREGESAASSD